MFYIVIDEDNRVIASCEEKDVLVGSMEVETLPEGELGDYRYINEYIYAPLPEPSGSDYVTYSEMAKAIREGVNSYGQ